MSGFIVFKSQTVLKLVERIDVNGFKFLYELLSVSKGTLDCNETFKFYAKKVWGIQVRYCNCMGFLGITNSLFIKKIIIEKQ